MPVPIIGRLNFRDYQALVIGLILLFLEALLRVITHCLPAFALEFFRGQSQKGYTVEEHIVRTQDHCILGIHRLPEGKYSANDADSKSRIESIFDRCGISHSAIRNEQACSSKGIKPVVLLYHGLMMCSEIWMCNLDEERRLACLLTDAGHPNSRKFWDYSMDEFALYDLPDTIDYILETTGAPSLTYIGFSQGAAQAFAALSINPKLNKKVNLFVALAPATSPKGLQNPIVDAFIKASPNIVYLFFGRKAFLTMTMFWQRVLSPPIFTKLLDTCMNFLFGWSGKNMTEEQKAASYYHLYNFTSVKSLVHWFQIIRANSFQMYDELPPYSSPTAIGHYCHRFPTEQIQTPISVFYGGSDSLVKIEVLLKQLPKPVFIKEVPPYEHLDFIWGYDVHTHVFPELFNLLRKYNTCDDETDMKLSDHEY
ncbi:27321_t:CDS:2 [Dentiscutata erythropus]|uniref:27321_t:CDS:1 n=1 Tax=Dentiscutata erythropus TaxID=1348616 RepID=A0A9N9BEL3_9GLOM|nr:27321_t:CDS:2 [Dentiscutata erythropus]